MVYCHVAHDCTISNNIVLANNVQVGGHVSIQNNAIIGGSCAVHQFSRIGESSMIGGMTGVLSDVIPFGLSLGNRNSLAGLNLIGLRRAKVSNENIKIIQEAYNTIFKSANFRFNIENLNSDIKKNKFVSKIIDFINSDKKRAIAVPEKYLMIGLFLGEKKLPIEILNKLKKRKIKYFIIDLTKNNKFKKDKNSFFISIGKFGEILKLIKSKNCKKVIFAGNISKPKISKLKLDLKGIYYIPRIIKASKLGDAAILKELIKILAEHKIKVIKLNFFNPELSISRGNYTKVKPSNSEILDIKKGINYLNKLNAHNHTQGIVIRKGIIIAKETYSGTQSMLKN